MWFVFEYLAMAAVATVMFTQVLYPIVMGTKIFPMLRRRKLAATVVEARERLEQDRIAQEASELWSRTYGSTDQQGSDLKGEEPTK